MLCCETLGIFQLPGAAAPIHLPLYPSSLPSWDLRKSHVSPQCFFPWEGKQVVWVERNQSTFLPHLDLDSWMGGLGCANPRGLCMVWAPKVDQHTTRVGNACSLVWIGNSQPTVRASFKGSSTSVEILFWQTSTSAFGVELTKLCKDVQELWNSVVSELQHHHHPPPGSLFF